MQLIEQKIKLGSLHENLVLFLSYVVLNVIIVSGLLVVVSTPESCLP